MQIYWAHTIAYGNANGVAWVNGGTGGNGDAVSVGGYATVASTGLPPSETDGTSAQGLYPVVGTFPLHDNNYNAQNMSIGFAVPNGQSVWVHFWVATA